MMSYFKIGTHCFGGLQRKRPYLLLFDSLGFLLEFSRGHLNGLSSRKQYCYICVYIIFVCLIEKYIY